MIVKKVEIKNSKIQTKNQYLWKIKKKNCIKSTKYLKIIKKKLNRKK